MFILFVSNSKNYFITLNYTVPQNKNKKKIIQNDFIIKLKKKKYI